MRNLRQYNSKYTSRIVAAVLILAVLPLVSWASRPFVTEDAGVAGRGTFQVETSWDYFRWHNNDREQALLFVPIYRNAPPINSKQLTMRIQ